MNTGGSACCGATAAGNCAATGRVLEAKPAASSGSGSSLEPGYLRIVLVSVNISGRPVMIETSSIFAKGGSRDERNPAAERLLAPAAKIKVEIRISVFGIDRRLNFRLAQTVDLQ